MQNISVYLYPNKVDAYTNPVDSLTAERYRKVYNRNLKIYRSVDNRIDLQLRNFDQKSLTISNPLIFTMISRDSRKIVLQKDFTLVADDTANNLKGRAYVTLTSADMLDIEEGTYNYSVVQEARQTFDGTSDYSVTSSTLLYIDSQYGGVATIEVAGDVLGTTTNSLSITNFSYSNPAAIGSETPIYYTSSLIDARPKLGTPQDNHTFQFYFKNFTGEVAIQGSLDDQGSQSSHWSDLLVFTPTDANAPEYRNITGKYSWFRIKYKPSSRSGTASFVISQTILGDYQVGIRTDGSGYNVGDQILFAGNKLGGETPTHDLTITVTSVDAYGKITGITWTGLSYNGVKTFVLDGVVLNGGGVIDKVLYR